MDKMKNKRIAVIWLISFILIILKLAIIEIAKSNSRWVEQYYSRGIYPIISKLLTGISNLFPFSIGEIIITFAVIFLIIAFIKIIILIIKKQYLEMFNKISKLVLILVIILCFLDLSWLMNNYREDIRSIMELPDEEINKDSLGLLFEALVIKTNDIREQISDDITVKEILHKADEGYKELNKHYSFINKGRVDVKGQLSSKIQTISGYTGIYLFFIGEPTVNIQTPIFTLPFTACHEIAHQKGFAKEDEANYIGFLACIANDSVFFKYSGYFTAMQYVGVALYREDPILYKEISSLQSNKVKEDINFEDNFWHRNKNEFFTKVADNINDSYLKTYNQPEGIKSYGKFIDLLLLEFIKNDL